MSTYLPYKQDVAGSNPAPGMVRARAAAVSVVVAPEAQNLDDLLLVQNLVHEPVLDVDAP